MSELALIPMFHPGFLTKHSRRVIDLSQEMDVMSTTKKHSIQVQMNKGNINGCKELSTAVLNFTTGRVRV